MSPSVIAMGGSQGVNCVSSGRHTGGTMIRPLATVDEPGLESQAPHAAPDLASLQAEFPRYRIWREGICGRVRYVARSLEHGLRPHTVVTGDLAEMQAAL